MSTWDDFSDIAPVTEIVTWPEWNSGIEVGETFAPRKLTGWRSLVQRVCFWALRKLKAYSTVFEQHYAQRIYIPPNVGEAIMGGADELFKFLARYDGEVVVVMGEQVFRDYVRVHRGMPGDILSFETKTRVGFPSDKRDRRTGEGIPFVKIYGYRVVVIPWMKGIHVLPLDYLLGRR